MRAATAALLMTPRRQLLSNCAQCLVNCFCCCCRGATTQLGKLSFCRSTLLLLDQLSRRCRRRRRSSFLSDCVRVCVCVNCAANMPVAFFCCVLNRVVVVLLLLLLAAHFTFCFCLSLLMHFYSFYGLWRICKDYGGGNQLLLRCYCAAADSLIHFANNRHNETELTHTDGNAAFLI